jgi:ADP-ribosylglycohydrolase
MRRNSKYFRGCLIGGATGDAMGWPVEFLKLEAIKVKYGENHLLRSYEKH